MNYDIRLTSNVAVVILIAAIIDYRHCRYCSCHHHHASCIAITMIMTTTSIIIALVWPSSSWANYSDSSHSGFRCRVPDLGITSFSWNCSNFLCHQDHHHQRVHHDHHRHHRNSGKNDNHCDVSPAQYVDTFNGHKLHQHSEHSIILKHGIAMMTNIDPMLINSSLLVGPQVMIPTKPRDTPL